MATRVTACPPRTVVRHRREDSSALRAVNRLNLAINFQTRGYGELADVEGIPGRCSDCDDTSFKRPEHGAGAAVSGELIVVITDQSGRKSVTELLCRRPLGVEFGTER